MSKIELKRDMDPNARTIVVDGEFVGHLLWHGGEWRVTISAGVFRSLPWAVIEAIVSEREAIMNPEPAENLPLEKRIPPLTLSTIRNYVENRVPPGSFTRAVLSNDFIGAACRADSDNMKAIREIALFVHNRVPSICCGSREKVNNWIDGIHPRPDLVGKEVDIGAFSTGVISEAYELRRVNPNEGSVEVVLHFGIDGGSMEHGYELDEEKAISHGIIFKTPVNGLKLEES